MPSRIKPGDRFHMLTVIERSHYDGKSVFWRCRCDCGNESLVRTSNWKREVKSCGCLKRSRENFPNAQAAVNRLIDRYKRGAVKRGQEWNLSESEFRAITGQNCAYCGSPPAQRVRATSKQPDQVYVYNGIDRIDSGRGYTPDNCVTCCVTCNRMKSDLSVLDFLRQVERIANHTLTLPFAPSAPQPAA